MKALPNILLIIFIISTIDLSADDTSVKLMDVFVAPKQELIVVQWKNLNSENLELSLCNISGQIIQETILAPGSTVAYFETQTLYEGEYLIKVSNGIEFFIHKITLKK